MALYDQIGHGYRSLRRPDPRIAAQIERALGPAKSIVNVGAGAGSYEPLDRDLVAVEPSAVMVQQRNESAAPVVRGVANALPFRDDSFDASLAILTIHHWSEQSRGLHELRRAARSRCVILTWDPNGPDFWLTDYVPDILDIDRPVFPSMESLRRQLGRIEVQEVKVPHDCMDGFMCAYWRRPHAYLSAHKRSAISTFAKLGRVEPGLERLRDDLASGEWKRRYGHLLARKELDLGYRLVIAH